MLTLQLLALVKLNMENPKAIILVKIREGSCEIKTNSISKLKIVFHIYTNGVRKLPICSADLTRPITKNGRGGPRMFQ